jgi:hypothetical protein
VLAVAGSASVLRRHATPVLAAERAVRHGFRMNAEESYALARREQKLYKNYADSDRSYRMLRLSVTLQFSVEEFRQGLLRDPQEASLRDAKR